MNQFALLTAPGGLLLTDYSSRVQKLTIATNTRGHAECSGFVPMGIAEAFQLYDRAGLPHAVFADSSSGAIYEGRLEDVDIVDGGVNLRAFGYSRALGDAPYTALWSAVGVAGWRVMTLADLNNRDASAYLMDTNNRLFLGLKKNAVYTNGVTDIASWMFEIPSGSSRKLTGISFDLVQTLPSNWKLDVEAWNSGFSSGINIKSVTGGTGLTVMNIFIDFSATPRDLVIVQIYNTTGAPYTNTSEDGAWSARFTNVRLVTATTNAVNTTTTAGVVAGSGVSVPVVSSARMYVGQRLHMGIPASLGFNATVLSVPDATHFTADLSAAMASGGNVQAFVVYADEIAKDLVSAVATLNATQLSSSTALIQSPALDLFSESYEDRYPSDILDRLITLGDNQVPPRQWEWSVGAGRLLTYRPQNSAARTWYIDIAALNVQRSIDDLWNSTYATYQEAGGRTLRTASNTDASSPTRHGVTRRKAVSIQTTSATQAGIQRDAALNDSKDPKPRSGLTIDRVFDASGQRWPLWIVVTGDTMIIRNLAPTLSTAIDRIRVFRLTRTEYHADDDTLTIEPESPLPSLSAMLALAVPPSWVTAPWWVQIRQL